MANQIGTHAQEHGSRTRTVGMPDVATAFNFYYFTILIDCRERWIARIVRIKYIFTQLPFAFSPIFTHCGDVNSSVLDYLLHFISLTWKKWEK